MIDGIHKTLSLSKHWKRVLRLCNRPADRGEPARKAVEHALLTECSAAMSPRFKRNFLEFLKESESLLPGIEIIHEKDSSWVPGGNDNPFRETISKGLKLGIHKKFSGINLAEFSLVSAIGDWGARHRRQLEQHCLKNGGKISNPIFKAISDAFSVDLFKLSKLLLSGEKMDKQAVIRPIDLDEDLR